MPEQKLTLSQAQTMSDYLSNAFGRNPFQCGVKDLMKTQKETYQAWAKSYAELFSLTDLAQIESDLSSAYKLSFAEETQELYLTGHRNF